MNIIELNKILLEYKNSNNLSSISTNLGGKNLDNIATGVTNQYATNKSTNKQDSNYPKLTKLVQQIKNDSFKGDKIVTGLALQELMQIIQSSNIKYDENGQIILPIGKNVRLIQRGNNFFINLKTTYSNDSQEITDISKLPSQIS